jgi:hypothetical protein
MTFALRQFSGASAGQAPKRAKATLPDFHEEMGLENQRRAFALSNSKTSRALEAS